MQAYVDWFKWDDAKHPLSNAPEPKRRFIPSKWEAKKVMVRRPSFNLCTTMKEVNWMEIIMVGQRKQIDFSHQ